MPLPPAELLRQCDRAKRSEIRINSDWATNLTWARSAADACHSRNRKLIEWILKAKSLTEE